MANNRSQLVQLFVRTITHDVKSYQQLLPLLQQQKSLYLQFDSQALNHNIEQQTPLLNQLHRSANERSHCLQQLGLSANDHSVQRLLNALPITLNHKLRTQWQTLKSLIQQCQQLNHSNGQLSASFQELLAQVTQPTQHVYEERPF